MKNKWAVIIMSALLSLSFISGCNLGDDDVEPLDVDNGRFYDMNDDLEPLDNDRFRGNMNRNERLDNDRFIRPNMDNDNGLIDRDRNLDNGIRDFDLDTDNIRRPGEMDTPFNMDEEEPDLDEEPSEERRD